MELNQESVRATAANMVALHRDSSYKPEERAVDHAYSYDSGDWRRRYWLDVALAISEIYAHQPHPHKKKKKGVN